MSFGELERCGWTVTLPVDAGLARLLREGAHADRVLSPAGRKVLLGLATTAERRPEAGARAVEVGRGMAGVAADELAALLARSRSEDDPAAGSLASFAAEWFGVTETGADGD